jgi:hypothetical protein
VTVKLSLDREAAALLRHYAGGPHLLGAFVDRLLYTFHARRAERALLLQALAQLEQTELEPGPVPLGSEPEEEADTDPEAWTQEELVLGPEEEGA